MLKIDPAALHCRRGRPTLQHLESSQDQCLLCRAMLYGIHSDQLREQGLFQQCEQQALHIAELELLLHQRAPPSPSVRRLSSAAALSYTEHGRRQQQQRQQQLRQSAVVQRW